MRRAIVEVGNHKGEHDFVVLPVLDGFDVILGRSFLKRSRAIVDHAASTVAFRSGASQSRKVKIGKESGCASSFGALVASLVDGQDVYDQDRILRAHGLAAAPVGTEVVANRVTVSTEVHSAVMTTVCLYEKRMRPFIGNFPPSRGEYDHSISLVSADVRPKARRAIPLSARHQQALAKELTRLLEAGFIRVSRSEWAAPVFFVPKNELEDRMVCDFRALNAVTVTNNASLPYVKELFARLKGCVIFSKLDLTSGYHQLRLRESDVPLTGFITPLGHFEWLVMPFGKRMRQHRSPS